MNLQPGDVSPVSLNASLSRASYWLPAQMATSAWIEHAPFGFWIVDALRPRSVVELGVHHGFSYFVLCQAVQRLRLSARCFAIDSWVGDDHAGYYGDEVYDEVCRRNRPYDAFSRLIRSEFADACGQFADGSIDLLHIDGCHTYEAVRADFESWLPKLSKRGVMLLHDTAEYAEGFGVHRLWAELRGHYPHFEFMHGHGLGLVGVGEEIPAPVRSLLQGNADASQAVRNAYERLGGYVANLQRLEEVEALRQRVLELETVVASYQASTSWRVTAPLRAVARAMKSANGVAGDFGETLRDVANASGDVAKPAYRSDL